MKRAMLIDRRQGYRLIIIFSLGMILFSQGIIAREEASARYHPLQALVKLKHETTLHSLQKEAGLPNFGLKHEYNLLGRLAGARYLVLEFVDTEALDIRAVVDRLADTPGVEAASLNVNRRLLEIPDDPLFHLQWGLHNTGQQAFIYRGVEDIDIDAPEAWARLSLNPGTGESVVAVIDTGVDPGHPDLAGNIWINNGETPGNGIDDDGNGYIDDVSGYDFAGDKDGANDPFPVDFNDHGTHIAGIIAASTGNGIGVAGVDLNAKVLPLKIFSPGSERSSLSDELEAFEYVLHMKTVHEVNIVAINCSFGSEDFSSLEYDVVNRCREAGIAVVCAAGNGGGDSVGDDTDLYPLYPASYDSPNILSVTAVNNRGELDEFSNFGVTTVDIAAPGIGIMSTFRRGKGSEAMALFGGERITAFSLEFGGRTPGISGFLYDCGKGITIADFPPGVHGNIALIERGDVFFSQKVTNAQLAGATAAIIYNDRDGNFTGTLQDDADWIPALTISRDDGLRIAASNISSQATVINRISNYGYKSGTSMAAPFASGALALLARHFPADDIDRRLARLLLGVKPIDTLQTKIRYGAILGLPHSDIREPLDVSIRFLPNESLFTTEYIATVSFRPNPRNDMFDIQSYRIYHASGTEMELIAEIPVQPKEIVRQYSVLVRKVKKRAGNLYAVIAVDRSGNKGAPAFTR